MGKSNKMVDQLGQTVRDQEYALLNNIQTSMSFLDDDEEMNEDEFRVTNSVKYTNRPLKVPPCSPDWQR